MLPGLLFAVLVVAVYSNPLFLRRTFAGRDLLLYNLPIENAVHAAYRRGELPVWINEISGGRPLLPNPNAGALYPIRPLLSLVPFPIAARVYPVFHWILSGVGIMLLVRSLPASAAAAWIAAVTYVFSGVGVSEVFFPHIQPGMTLLPFVVWTTARSNLRPVHRTLWLSVLFGLLLLAGDVFTIGLGIGSAVLWILLEVDRPRRPGLIASVAGAVALAFLLAAPQILATALWIPETSRAVLGLTLGQSFFLSLSPLRLLELLVPYPFGETWSLEDNIWGWPIFNDQSVGLFATLYAGSFAFFALVTLWRRRDPGVRFARYFGVIALVASVPPSLTPQAWKRLPSPIALRNPEKFAVAVVFALAILAGVAWDAFRRSPSRDRWTLPVAAVLAALAVGAIAFPAGTGRLAVALARATPDMAPRAGAYLPGAFAEAGLLWMTVVVSLALLRASHRGAAAGALVLLTAAPVVASRRIARVFREEEVFAQTAFARILRREDPRGDYRTIGQSVFRMPTRRLDLAVRSDPAQLEVTRRGWYEYAHAIWKRGTVLNEDLDRGDFSRVNTLRRVTEIAIRSASSGAFFANLSLRFGIRYQGQPPLPGYRRFGGDSLQEFDEHVNAYPDVRLARRWRETPGGIPALREIGGVAPGEVLVESGVARSGTAREGRVTVLEEEPERLVLRTETPDPTWLFVLRAHWNHRTVRLDGREVEVLPAQLAFSAVAVPPGVHRIEWTERVPGGEVSRWGPVLFLAAAVGMVLGGRWRAR